MKRVNTIKEGMKNKSTYSNDKFQNGEKEQQLFFNIEERQVSEFNSILNSFLILLISLMSS
jgi:hypothetical protein